jgi:hypothetical protein
MISIKTVQTRLEAEVVKGFLETHGITVFITADDKGGASPFPLAPTVTGVHIFVKESDVSNAKKLLQSVK